MVWALTLASALAAQPAARGSLAQVPQALQPGPVPPINRTGLILGQVVDAAGGVVSTALVTLSGSAINASSTAPGAAPPAIPPGPRRAFTNGEGRFVFSDLPKGSYTITVTKPGYAQGALGRRRPNGPSQSLELQDGGRSGAAKITMWKFAALSGTLTDDVGDPLVGATVWSLMRSYSTGRSKFTDGPSATTDDRGFFRVTNLLPGDHAICVVAAQSSMPVGLIEQYAAARRAGTTAEFQRQYNSSAIGFTARVPTAGIRVGESVLHTVGPFSTGMVPPAPGEDGQILSFQTTCAPATVGLLTAEVFTLASGEERTGANIKLTLVPGVSVSGIMMGPAGPVPNLGVRLAADFAGELGYELTWESALTITDPQGRFTFLGVPAGSYTLRALKAPPLPGPVGPAPPAGPVPLSPMPPDPTLYANIPLVVGPEGLSNLTVRLGTGHRITGRFQFDGKLPKPQPRALQSFFMVLEPADGHQIGYSQVLRGRTEADGSFSTFEIPPGRYFVRMTTQVNPAGWTHKSSLVNGRDVSSTPLDLQGDVSSLVIVMTDAPSEITGTIRDENGRVDPTASAIVFSAERADWSAFGETPRRISRVRPDPNGIYRVAGLPPGQYFVVALDDSAAEDWQDPRVLQTLARTAVPLTLGDGEKKTQDVVSRPVR